jgi:hypothetical protein
VRHATQELQAHSNDYQNQPERDVFHISLPVLVQTTDRHDLTSGMMMHVCFMFGCTCCCFCQWMKTRKAASNRNQKIAAVNAAAVIFPSPRAGAGTQ